MRYNFPNLYSHALDTDITLRFAGLHPQPRLLFRAILTDIAESELQDMQRMLSTLDLQQNRNDDITWRWTQSGIFTVKSANRALQNRPRIQNKVHRVWKLQIPSRMKVFGWLMEMNRLLTIDNLNKRGWMIPNRCILCKAAMETVQHMMNECPFSLAMYQTMAGENMNRMPVIATATSTSTLFSSTQVTKTTSKFANNTVHHLEREMCKNFQRKQQKNQRTQRRSTMENRVHADRKNYIRARESRTTITQTDDAVFSLLI